MTTTHREWLIATLRAKGIEFSATGGDSIIVNDREWRFYANGRLKEVLVDGVPTAYAEF